jgi:adenosylcobinamide-GDP ribazoletransferase
VKLLGAAIALLTRVPVGRSFELPELGRSARWFPLIGALMGGIYAGIAYVVAPRMPSSLVAVLIVIAEALLTGALHMDGLADTADGFGGGKDREDTLRIMRDPAVGSYGALAIVLLVAVKVAVIAALSDRRSTASGLVLASSLGRWAIVPLCRFLPYARPSPGMPNYVGTPELVWASLFAASVAFGIAAWRGLICWCFVMAVTAWFGWYCRRKIAGVTGDTLGACAEICETTALLAFLLLI